MPRKFLGGKPTVGTTNTPVVVESRTITATDPVTIAGGTSADLSSDRTIAVKDANTSGQKGVVSLTDSTSTTSSTLAATATAVKAAYDASTTKVPTTRTISTTAPLTGGGDLSTDRTLAVSTFTGDSGSGGARGVVPAPAAGDAAAGKYLKADGTWATVSGSGGAPTSASYVVLGADATLSAERTLTGSTSVTVTDNGANGTVVLSVPSGGITTTEIADATIVNADISATAGIVDTKLATISTGGKVSNTATTATNANTASAIVARDASGNFTAGTITAALTGNASTATALSSARTFALTGDVTGSVSSDLTSGASIAASIGTGKVTSTHILDGTIVDGDISATAGIVDTKLGTISTAGKVSNSATTATASNGASTIVLRDASQNFSTAGTITAGGFSGPLTGNVTGTATGNIASTLADAKGEIPVGTASGPSSLALGTDGYVLTADSTLTTGVKWSAPAGSSTLNGPVVVGSTQSSATLGNNFALNATTTLLRYTGTADATLTGIAAAGPATPADGRMLYIFNATTFTVTLSHASASSTAAYRMNLPGATAVTLAAHEGVNLIYDGTSTAWRAAYPFNIAGNAATATTLATSRNINGTPFNGSADITVTAAAGTLTGTSLNTTVTSATGLVTIGTSPTITTPALTLSTTTSNTDGRIAWDTTNDYLSVGNGTAQVVFVPASVPTVVADFSKTGTLTTGVGTFRWYNDSGKTLTIKTIRASCGTAPSGTTSTPVTGASLVCDVNINGTTIWATQTQRVNIQSAANTGSTSTFGTSTITNGQYLTVDIDYVGSTTAGADLTVSIWLAYA